MRDGFRRAGLSTHVLICSGLGSRKISPASADEGIWQVAVPATMFHRLRPRQILATLLKGLPLVWRLRRFLGRLGVRTVVLLYPGAYAWPLLLLRPGNRFGLIVSCHGNDLLSKQPRSWASRLALGRVLRKANAITICAEHLASPVEEFSPACPLPIRLIANAVDAEHFTPPPPDFVRSDPRRTIVHVSNFSQKKRTMDIVEAFAALGLRHDSARLLMVGDGADCSRARRKAEELGLGEKVQFTGAVSDVRPYLWQADMFVLASEEEGAPLALLEAMACGLPYVSTAWGAAAHLPSGECGLTVPPADVPRLAAAMAALLEDPARRLAMANNARRRAQRDFGRQTYDRLHLELLEQIHRIRPPTSAAAAGSEGGKA